MLNPLKEEEEEEEEGKTEKVNEVSNRMNRRQGHKTSQKASDLLDLGDFTFFQIVGFLAKLYHVSSPPLHLQNVSVKQGFI